MSGSDGKEKKRHSGGDGGDKPAGRDNHKDGGKERDRDGDKGAKERKGEPNKRGCQDEQPHGPPVGETKDWPLGWIQRITNQAEFCDFVRDKTCNKCGGKGHLANAPHHNGAFVETATKSQWEAKPQQWKQKGKQSVRFAGAKVDEKDG